MDKLIDTLEDLLTKYGGYITIPNNKRTVSVLPEECNDYKIISKVKSIVWVNESLYNGECFIRIKVIDEGDIMWDLEEYMDTESVQKLIGIIKSL